MSDIRTTPIKVSREEAYELIEHLLYVEAKSRSEDFLSTTAEARMMIEKLEDRLLR